MCARRILYLSKGGNIGGSHRQLLLLLKGLDASYDPMVVCMTEGEIVEELRSAGIHTEVLALRPWRKLRNGLCRYVDAERLVALARRFQPACIHASDMWLGNHLNWLRWRLKVPSVVHVRGPVTRRGLRKHSMYDATGLISISDKISRVLRKTRIRAEKIVQIEDAVDTDYFRPPEGRLGNLSETLRPDSVVNVGLVGRIEPAKRQLEFIQIALEVNRHWAGRARFFVIGEVRNRAYSARLDHFIKASGLDGALAFTGRRDDMPTVLNSLDVLVSLSGGSVMYEAMSCGLCVVSAGFTRPGDSIHLHDGQTGIVTPTANPPVVARILGDLIQRSDVRRKLGAAARVWAVQRLSHAVMVARTTTFYNRLLGSSS